jgi:hypothetical protein
MRSPTRKPDQTKNPINNNSTLFQQLTRLMSGPLVRHRSQAERQLRKRNLLKFSNRFKSTSGLKFRREQYNPFEALNTQYMAAQARVERYMDFEQMEFGFLKSVLSIYADEMTTSSPINPMIRINCPNEEIKFVLQSLYRDILQLDFNLFGWARNMCKYGDFFLYLDIDETKGIKSCMGLPVSEIERLEGQDPENPEYIQFQWNASGMTFEHWQVAHFRVLGDDKYAPYGTSVLDAARRVWRQFVMLQDAVMAYRIVRSPERKVFYIDTSAIAPEDREQYVQRVATSFKRNQVINSDTGKIDLRYNPYSVEEDYYIATNGEESKTRIETLPGGAYTGDMDDVKFWRDQVFAAVMVPESYLFNDGSEDQTTLAQKDIRFARTIQRLQKSLIEGLEKIGTTHLYILGYRGDDIINFNLTMNNPSKIAELQELEQWRTKFGVAAAVTEGYFSRRWVVEHIFGISNEEYLRCQREMFFDAKLDASIAEGEGTGGGFEGGGDIGGMEGSAGGGSGLDVDLPTGDEPGAPDEEEASTDEPEDDGALLVDPDSGDKGKSRDNGYVPVKNDGRKFEARRRNMNGMWGKEQASGSSRNIFGKPMSQMGRLGRGLQVREGANSPNYEENSIKETSKNIKNVRTLIETLERDFGVEK